MCNFISRVNFNTRLAHMSLQGHSIRQHRHQYNAMYRGGYGGAYHHHHTQQLHQMPQPHVHGSGSSAHGHHMGGQPYQSHGTYRQQRQQLALPQGGGDYMFNSLPVHQQHAAGPIPFGGCGPMPSRGGVVVPPGPPLKHHHGSAHHHHHHHHQQTMPPPRVLSPSQGHSFDPVFTSRPTSYTNNPPPEMSVMPLSGSSSYFTQQQNPEPAQLATSDVPRQTVGQRASASDYVVSSLLVTYM
uniref:Uncharacterized protein TCIL3000_11_16460 n=1 Tax=Trypanosoma congolense (strain IL3000) TaxID=1068625 RepID=G0V3B1_TRYCI|nr:unnamed protein product [Trypanosoma congolense IL3000]